MSDHTQDPMVVGPTELMLVSEHDSIVEHLEEQNAALYNKIEMLLADVKKLNTDLAKYKLHAAKVGKGW